VRAYVNGDQKTVFDRYSDWIYFGAFIMSGLGSVAAGLFGWMSGKREDGPTEQQRRIQAALDAVGEAPDRAELDRLEGEANEIFSAVFASGAKDELSAASIASFDMALCELRARIAARRASLP
jgi:hypothetical protein